MMAAEQLEAFYSADEAKRARERHLEEIIVLLPWIARIDAFQHWLYTHRGHTHAEREAQWLELDSRFGDDLDWAEFPEWQASSWIRQLHIFCVPLYYIEYGIAQLGALQLWSNFLEKPGEAVQQYRGALSLGNTRPLPELCAASGLRFAFDESTVEPLARKVASALGI
jgi:oligoendopeptidase F